MPNTAARRLSPWWVLVVLCLTPATVRAQYLDPGAASIIVQAIVAGVVAVAAGVKLYWGRVSALFSRRRPQKDTR